MDVVRNNAIPFDHIDDYRALVLSPGPGLPKESGDLMQVIAHCARSKPILGVCLGQQALCEHFAGRLINLPTVRHGSASSCRRVVDDLLFEGLPESFEVGHYHSWVVDATAAGEGMEVTAVNSAGWPMAVRHQQLPIRGVQFHPESVMTPHGQQMITNWVKSIEE